MTPLTKRQQEIYDFILKHCQKHGGGPSVRQIAEAFDLSSPNGAFIHIRLIEKKGWIVRNGTADHNGGSQSRGIRPTCSYKVEAVS